MDVYSIWEAQVSSCKTDVNDIESVSNTISRASSSSDRILNKILRDVYDTDDIVYIMKELSLVLGVDLNLIKFTNEQGDRVTAEFNTNEDCDNE